MGSEAVELLKTFYAAGNPKGSVLRFCRALWLAALLHSSDACVLCVQPPSRTGRLWPLSTSQC